MTSTGIDWTGTATSIANFDQSKFGWRSTQTITEPGVMEIQHNGDDKSNLYVELCAFEKNTAIYQDIATIPDSVYKWTLKHSSLNSNYIDKMQVLIGPAGNEKVSSATRIASDSGQVIGEISDTIVSTNSKASGPTWNTYQGYAYIPSSQTTTRFTFKSIDALAATSGNLLDDISFNIAYPLYYDVNGGNGELPAPTDSNYSGYHNSSENITLSNVIPTKDNCTFIGWSTEKIADIDSDAAYNEAKSKIIDSVTFEDSAITVYAVYKMNSYTVQFVDGLTNESLKTETVYYGHDATAPDVPMHKGYVKTDWNKDYLNITDDLIVIMSYRPIAYMIRYEPNGATNGNMPAKDMEYNEVGKLDKNQFTRKGYTFVGWVHGDKTYNDEAEISNLTETDNATITMTAQWKPISYTIIFDKNRTDASGITESMNMTYDVSKTLTPNGFASSSSKFSTWNTKSDGSGTTYSNKQEVKNLVDVANDSITLYAQWSSNTYIVTFIDGLTGETITSPNINHGGSATPPTKPVHKGYTATIWNGNYQNVIKDETVTLNYRPNAYEISFKANGGNGTMPNEQMQYDVAKELDKNVFKKVGYTFIGWKNQNGDDTYVDRQSVKNLIDTDGGIVTLIAQWKANSYIVKYDANGGTGTMPNQKMEYDKESQLSSNTFKRSGYSFIGWKKDDKVSGKSYRNRESVINLLTENDGVTTMYAQWEANAYTVTFIDGYNGKTITTETVQYGNTAPDPIKPYHDGYTSTNWDKSLSNITSDTIVTLNYRPNKYVIQFNKNGMNVDGSTENKSMEYDKADILTTNGYLRQGYTWTGWSDTADGNGKQYSDRQNVINLTSTDGATITLYAQWKINRYTVTFIDGKTNDVINRQEVDYQGDAALPTIPVHNGYKPTGWNNNGKNIISNTTITVSYEPISYEIAFDKNSDKANGKMQNQQMKYDTWANLNSNVFTRPGYHFIGWNTQSNASGIMYTDSERVYNMTNKDNEIVTLYAQWLENSHISIIYKIEVDDELGTNNISNSLDNINPIIGVPTGSIANASIEYNFIGWYDSNDKLISKAATFTPAKPTDGRWADAVYIAKFVRKTFNVSFVDRDGNTIKTENVKYGLSVTAPDAPLIDGYEFIGWDKAFDNVVEDAEIKAIYREIPKMPEPISNESVSAPEPIKETASNDVDNDLIQTGIEIAPFVIGVAIAIIGLYYTIRKKH